MSFLYSGLWSTTMNIKTFFFITMLMRNIKGCLTIYNTFTRSDAYLAFVNVQAGTFGSFYFYQCSKYLSAKIIPITLYVCVPNVLL